MTVPPFLPPVKRPLHPFGWIRPAGSSEYRVTQMYAHVNPAISSSIHGGMDMGNGSLGGPLFAPADGEVIAEGWLLAPWSSPSTRWPPAPNYGGIMVVIWHGGYISALAHMERTIVNKGQQVKAGQQVGNLGATGAAKEFGGHVHWDLYRKLAPGEPSGELRAITYANAQWRKVDPWPLLAQNYVAPPDTSIATPKEDTMRYSGATFHVAPNVPVYRLTVNANFRVGPDRSQTSLGVFPAGTPVPIAYFVNGESIGGNTDWALCFLYVNGAYTSGFLHSSVLEAAPAPVTDCTDAVKRATGPLDHALTVKDDAFDLVIAAAQKGKAA